MGKLQDVFRDTRKRSATVYKQETDALKEHTEVYVDADNEISDSDMMFRSDMEIKVVPGGTVSTAYRLSLQDADHHVAMLNFADAKRPGGWVIEGAYTQEENICRCTNLYETLVQAKCLNDYYVANLSYGVGDAEHHYVEPYTDRLIYAEGVSIFKDDVTYMSIPVKQVDVITSPAPCGSFKGVDKVLMHRMRGIIKSAYLHNVTHIVLGAWGCGAFMQSPKVVAQCFATVLKELPVFEQVIFAIRPTGIAVENNTKDRTFSVFEKTFRKSLI